MTQADFRALREQLESAANPPDFDAISRWRHRRTRRWTTLGAAGLTLIVLASVTWGLRGGGKQAEPVTPPLPTVSSVSSASGTLFALDPTAYLVWFSTDRGAHWRKLMSHLEVNGSPATARLAAANANSTWMVTDAAVFYVSENNWTAAPVTAVSSYSVAKERLWLVTQGEVQIRTARRDPVHASALPAPASRVVALSAEAALAMTSAGTWYYTYDAGVQWTPRPGPCPSVTSIAAALDRSVWAVCADGQLLVSTNDGDTWQARGSLEGTSLSPISKTIMWCTGKGGTIRRTVDGAGFETVFSDVEGRDLELTALDAETAMRLDADLHAHVTRDGGRTWTAVGW